MYDLRAILGDNQGGLLQDNPPDIQVLGVEYGRRTVYKNGIIQVDYPT